MNIGKMRISDYLLSLLKIFNKEVIFKMKDYTVINNQSPSKQAKNDI